MIEKTDKQKAMFAAIAKLKDQLSDDQALIDFLHQDVWQLTEELNAAIKRAEKAEREAERLGEIVTECDGVECIKHDSLVRIAVERAEEAESKLAEQKERARVGRLHKMKKITKLRDALKLYGNPDNWRFTHDKENNLLWVTSLGPDYAMEILNEANRESSEEREAAHATGDGTLTIKKGSQ